MAPVRDPGRSAGGDVSLSPITGFMERASLRLDVERPDYLGPFHGILRHEVCEIGRRPGHRNAAEIVEPRDHPRIGKSGIDLPVELVDDRFGRAPGGTESERCAYLVAGHEFGDGWDIRQF